MRIGTCTRCGKTNTLVNTRVLKKGGGEWCADCFDEDGPITSPGRKTGRPAVQDEAGPSWDDAVNAYEEDR